SLRPVWWSVGAACAAGRGCAVTVAKLVDQSSVRAPAHMTRIPASAVRAVVEAPFGAHPGGLLPVGLDGITAYGEDYEFWADIKKASREPGAMDTWIRKWVLETGTHESYLKKLGAERVNRLRRRSDPDGYRAELEESLVT